MHHGFQEALRDIWPALTIRLSTLSATRAVWFCGHSLGAAFATAATPTFMLDHMPKAYAIWTWNDYDAHG